MKSLCIFITLTFLIDHIFAQQQPAISRIFIVRHAEKETGKDPVLTPEGYRRAGDLMRALQNEGVQKIYVSQYKRSQYTADSLRIQLHIDTVHYVADTLCDFLINMIMEHRDFGKTLLIIAHSNTIPQIIRKLGVTDYPYGDLPDKAYDDLFLITYKKERARLTNMKYGVKSAAR